MKKQPEEVPAFSPDWGSAHEYYELGEEDGTKQPEPSDNDPHRSAD